MALLDNVDPNPENYVCAGVVQSKSQQVGCLLRLEPNAQAQVHTNTYIIVWVTKSLYHCMFHIQQISFSIGELVHRGSSHFPLIERFQVSFPIEQVYTWPVY